MADAQERARVESEMVHATHQKLIESGERDRLRELLRTRLRECGWSDELKAMCKKVIRERGVENVTVDDIMTEITPHGRASVPDSVKRDLLHKIKAFVTEHSDL